MSKITYVRLEINGMRSWAVNVIKTTLEIADCNPDVQLHQLPLQEFFERVGLPESLTMSELKQLLSWAVKALGCLDEVDCETGKSKYLGSWPIIQRFELSRQNILFEIEKTYHREIHASLISGKPYPVALRRSNRR